MRNIELMTYEEWKEVERIRKAEKAYYIKQKICGMLLAGAGIATAFIFGDATVNIITLPVGLYAVFTREKIMVF